MDLCGPMRVASINGKRYILMIVDDYSRFTWVRFLRTKDEASEAIIKCIKNIQVRLNATVRNVRTDNGTKFVNQILHEFYENVGISHQTSVARTPQQNNIKPVQATKGIRIKTKAKVAKSDKKKQPAKMPKAKGLDVLSKVALTEAEQLKLATKRSKTRFHSSHASGSGDGIDTQSKVPDEQHLKTTGADEGTGTIPRVPDVPIYEYESKKESLGDTGEEDENDENIFEDKSDGNDDDDNDDDDANDDDNQGDDTNDDDKETDSDSTESDRIKILVLNQSNTEYYEEEENTDDEETMDEEEDDEVTKELYDDVN
ncbi:retrovirus-related pol polyprotein from transposon TNT 1-94, partial [Tanacetum coccineum]